MTYSYKIEREYLSKNIKNDYNKKYIFWLVCFVCKTNKFLNS